MKRFVSVRLVLACSVALLTGEARAQLEGTLFTKPEEREYLDYLRAEFLRNNAEDDFNIQEVDIPEIPDAAPVEDSTGPVEYSFGGVMARRDGTRIWLNGKLLTESELPEGFSIVQADRSVSLRIENNGNTYVLLPGQTLDTTAGTVIENFRRPQPALALPASVTPEASPEEAVATAAEVPQTAEAAEPQTADGNTLQTSEGTDVPEAATESQAPATDPDALAAAANALDDSEVDALFEILENRRLERTTGAGSDEEPNSENP